jgi:hypothetical protein
MVFAPATDDDLGCAVYGLHDWNLCCRLAGGTSGCPDSHRIGFRSGGRPKSRALLAPASVLLVSVASVPHESVVSRGIGGAIPVVLAAGDLSADLHPRVRSSALVPAALGGPRVANRPGVDLGSPIFLPNPERPGPLVPAGCVLRGSVRDLPVLPCGIVSASPRTGGAFALLSLYLRGGLPLYLLMWLAYWNSDRLRAITIDRNFFGVCCVRPRTSVRWKIDSVYSCMAPRFTAYNSPLLRADERR